MARKTAEIRFWERVHKTDTCWLWTAGKDKNGYGYIWIGQKRFYAHRISWELHNGIIPEGLFVCHDCPGGDNSACVNPAHLWLGTAQDNMDDKVKKGRASRTCGEKNGNSKFTKELIRKIRSEYPAKTQEQLAAENGISRPQVSSIVRYEQWKHIE